MSANVAWLRCARGRGDADEPTAVIGDASAQYLAQFSTVLPL